MPAKPSMPIVLIASSSRSRSASRPAWRPALRGAKLDPVDALRYE
jgi:ABC-type lipoprotein release transport system permease subunit